VIKGEVPGAPWLSRLGTDDMLYHSGVHGVCSACVCARASSVAALETYGARLGGPSFVPQRLGVAVVKK